MRCHDYQTCVLVSFLEVISIRLKQMRWSQHVSIATYDRKRKQTVIFQVSYSLNASFPIEQYGSLKSYVLVITEFDFGSRERKKNGWLRLPNMCACKLSWGHIYPLKQTVWSLHVSIATYNRKRKQTVIFQISYSLNACFPIEQYGSLKSCVLVTTEFDFGCREKHFVGHHYQPCVLMSSAKVISVR